jgi:hypothetical protein
VCDFGQPHGHGTDFGFLVAAPEVRALIDETRRLTPEIADTAARVGMRDAPPLRRRRRRDHAVPFRLQQRDAR